MMPTKTATRARSREVNLAGFALRGSVMGGSLNRWRPSTPTGSNPGRPERSEDLRQVMTTILGSVLHSRCPAGCAARRGSAGSGRHGALPGLSHLLDGRLGQERGSDRWNDMDRDLHAATGGRTTIWLGWRRTEDRPCEGPGAP